jgi:hypothetical protein
MKLDQNKTGLIRHTFFGAVTDIQKLADMT